MKNIMGAGLTMIVWLNPGKIRSDIDFLSSGHLGEVMESFVKANKRIFKYT